MTVTMTIHMTVEYILNNSAQFEIVPDIHVLRPACEADRECHGGFFADTQSGQGDVVWLRPL